MPSLRPRAQFEPIPPNLNFERLVEAYDHFDFCLRIKYQDIQENGVDKFERLVRKHVIQDGKPLVVEGLDEVLDPWTFSARWLKDNVGDKIEDARDINNKEYIPLTIRHYLNSMNGVTSQHFRKEHERPPQRVYLKDIDCPEVWQQKLAEVIPPFLFYLNDSTGDWGGPGAKLLSNSTVPGRRLGRGIAPAGDLMSSFPPEMRAENLMCYIGHEGTYTPAHREMCATMGHNIMVEASSEIGEDGKPERPGSSIWFMTEAKDRQAVAEFWLSRLGHDIETENHFAQINSWKAAPFKVYIVDQRPGDFILIPPLAPHQVWNRGTRTMKVAWNRSTLETLEMAISEALPKARIVCRDEQYKNKAMIYYTLMKYSSLLHDARAQADKLSPDAGQTLLYEGKVRRLQREFKRLFILFKDIMLSEMFPPEAASEKLELLPFDSNVTCAYCRGNIFNRFLSCSACKDALGQAQDEPYDVCMECYAMGRSCSCISGHRFFEQFKWKELVAKYDAWRKQLINLLGDVDRTVPLSLQEERRRMSKKTLAEVVREQLHKRPFKDPSKPKEEQEGEEPSEEEVEVNDEGRVVKRHKKRSKAWLKKNSVCHVCKDRHENWRMARCTRCDRWWCYGVLFRGHDDMPLDIMENPDWECAHCQGVCFAGSCRHDARQTPYQPKGTLLGHDTKKVADARSVEVLVDFSVSNLNWIREDENQPGESAQMRRAREEGERARVAQPIDDEDEHDLAGEAQPIVTTTDSSNDFLDPELRSEEHLARQLAHFNSTHSESARDAHNGRNDGFAPAESYGTVPQRDENGFIGVEESYLYPDPREVDNGLPPDDDAAEYRPFTKKGQKAAGHKHARASDGVDEITMERPKKRRATDQGAEIIASRATNDASKQYQSVRTKRALDEAKRTGRYFSVNAALKGQRKVVVLKISPFRLRQIVHKAPQGAARRVTFATEQHPRQASSDADDLLKSDVRTKQSQHSKRRTKSVKKKAATSDVEDDEEGDASNIDDDFSGVTDNGILKPRLSSGRTSTDGKRQISAYLQARHANEDLPDVLPDDFRDSRRGVGGIGAANRKDVPLPQRDNKGMWQSKGKDKNAPTTKAEASSAGRSRGRPRKVPLQPSTISAPITINDDSAGDEDDVEEDDDDGHGHANVPVQRHPSLGKSAQAGRGQSITEQETNPLAKPDALHGTPKFADDNGDHAVAANVSKPRVPIDHSPKVGKGLGSGATVKAVHTPVQLQQQRAPVANMGSGPPSARINKLANGTGSGRKSIFDSGHGPGGRKVRIVSQANARKSLP